MEREPELAQLQLMEGRAAKRKLEQVLRSGGWTVEWGQELAPMIDGRSASLKTWSTLAVGLNPTVETTRADVEIALVSGIDDFALTDVQLVATSRPYESERLGICPELTGQDPTGFCSRGFGCGSECGFDYVCVDDGSARVEAKNEVNALA